MEDRLAVISCIISDPESVSIMNEKQQALYESKFIDIDKEVGEGGIFGTWDWEF